MAGQQGINIQRAGAFETTFATAPATGYKRLPVITNSLGKTRPIDEDDTLSGRRELAPVEGAVTVEGGKAALSTACRASRSRCSCRAFRMRK